MALCSEAKVDILSHSDDGGVDDLESVMLQGAVQVGADMMVTNGKLR